MTTRLAWVCAEVVSLLLGAALCGCMPGAGTYCQSGSRYGTRCYAQSDVQNPPGAPHPQPTGEWWKPSRPAGAVRGTSVVPSAPMGLGWTPAGSSSAQVAPPPGSNPVASASAPASSGSAPVRVPSMP